VGDEMNLLLAIIFYQVLWTDVLSQKTSNIFYKSLGDENVRSSKLDDNSDIKWNFGEKGEEISRMSDVFETSLESRTNKSFKNNF
jgi:hypothetical protein